jgi:ParB family chromosome partitioning protein
MSKKALGKGIGALFKDLEEGKELPPSLYEIQEVEIDAIGPNPDQPRKEFPTEALIELADSIKQKGVIQPLLVERRADANTFTLVAGERRLRASKMAGFKKVPVIIKDFSQEDRLEIALIENVQRENLTPIEEALGYKNLMERFHLSQEEIAQKMGKKRSTIANHLRLLKLPEDMVKTIHEGIISAGHARAILSVVNPADARILYNRILERSLSVREAENESAKLNQGKRTQQQANHKEKGKEVNLEMLDIEQRFIDALGTKVKICGDGSKGKIEIHYFSKEDLERLIEKLS